MHTTRLNVPPAADGERRSPNRWLDPSDAIPADGPLSVSVPLSLASPDGAPAAKASVPLATLLDPYERTVAAMLQLLWERGLEGDIDQRTVEAKGGDPLVLRDSRQRAKAISEAQRRYAAARAA